MDYHTPLAEGKAGRRAVRATSGYHSRPVKPFAEVARLLRDNEVGRRAWIETPYGRRLLCYADMTATGRWLPPLGSS